MWFEPKSKRPPGACVTLKAGLEIGASRMRSKKPSILGLALFAVILFRSEGACAQAAVQEEARLSKLTLLSFECALLAGDNREAHRLLEVGHTAGRAFLSGINNLTKVERMRLSAQIDLSWHQVWDGASQSVVAKPPNDSLGQNLWGPTTDFILGRIFSERATWANKVSGDSTADDQTRSANKSRMYREKKCSEVQYHRSHHTDAPTYTRSWHN